MLYRFTDYNKTLILKIIIKLSQRQRRKLQDHQNNQSGVLRSRGVPPPKNTVKLLHCDFTAMKENKSWIDKTIFLPIVRLLLFYYMLWVIPRMLTNSHQVLHNIHHILCNVYKSYNFPKPSTLGWPHSAQNSSNVCSADIFNYIWYKNEFTKFFCIIF